MDILSFVLGVGTVAIAALSTVSVVAYFKVSKVSEKTSDLERVIFEEVDRVHRFVDKHKNENESQFNEVYREIEKHINDIHREIDSRLDKLENKLVKKVA